MPSGRRTGLCDGRLTSGQYRVGLGLHAKQRVGHALGFELHPEAPEHRAWRDALAVVHAHAVDLTGSLLGLALAGGLPVLVALVHLALAHTDRLALDERTVHLGESLVRVLFVGEHHEAVPLAYVRSLVGDDLRVHH